ncbi:hypothetical protein D3C74_277300 [compost metagenome]
MSVIGGIKDATFNVVISVVSDSAAAGTPTPVSAFPVFEAFEALPLLPHALNTNISSASVIIHFPVFIMVSPSVISVYPANGTTHFL